LLALAMAIALAVTTTAFANVWEANPQGNWDAWSIWNLRARFLAAAGTLPQRAWSPALSWTHPEYPLLLPAFVARCWAYAGSITDAAPVATSYMFFLGLIATLTGGIAVWRSRTLGLLCGLALLGSPHFLREVPTQYADVPLACYFAAAIMFALIDRPQLAGLFAGFAAWTKDEGLLFLVVFIAAIAILSRAQLWRTAAGAIPGAALAVFFKLALAPHISAYLGAGASIHLSRLGQVLGAMAREVGAMTSGWYHPILPVIALALGLGIEYRKDLLFTGGICAAVLAGYVAILVGSPYDLTWQLQTSLSRLMVQVWPAILLFAFAALRAPESAAMVEAPPKARKKAGRIKG
jgi:hypothetical protein